MEDVDEPKLSYDRIGNDLTNVVRNDHITSSCLHRNFFAVGTLSGKIYVFDHEGNKINRRELWFHMRSVDSISIDERGEYVASCSSDRLVVYGLLDTKAYFNLMPDKPANVVAIDPLFNRPDAGRKFVAGDDRLIIYEPGLLTRHKFTVLPGQRTSRRQNIRSISWHGQYIAWATDTHVQIYDSDQGAVFTRIKRSRDLESSPEQDICQFCWKTQTNLLIGWDNRVKVCQITERPKDIASETQLRKQVEIVSIFETDFTICGLAPFNDNLLTLSIHQPFVRRQRRLSTDTQSSCDSSLCSAQSSSMSLHDASNSTIIPGVNNTTIESNDHGPSSANSTNSTINSSSDGSKPTGNSVAADCNSSNDNPSASLPRPSDRIVKLQTHILETFPTRYNEICKDLLTPNEGVTSINLRNSTKKIPYSLLSLHTEGLYYIVCPRDIIQAKPRGCDDHIDWLMQHSMLKECYEFARDHSSELSRFSLKEVEKIYMKHLMDLGTEESFSEAARLCASICGSDANSWHISVENLASLGQLKHLLPHLPKKVDGFHLEPKSYNYMLDYFLEYDSMSLFKAIKDLPHQLYDTQAIIDKVIQNLANDPENRVLKVALAELYTRVGNFEDAVNIYLDCNYKDKIFSLIRNNNLISILRNKVGRLMEFDADETAKLLMENIDSIPMKHVVERLETSMPKRYLVSYLHRLILKDPDSCIEYHDRMVKLYAQYQKESLLSFLKVSTNYRLEEALEVCKEANLIKEVVFLLGRMGDLRIALKYITEFQGISEAIEFCKEHQDKDLWQDLIVYSMDKPEFIGELLKNIGTHIDNPIDLIERIPEGCQIEGLMPALVKILQDYRLQISLEQSCRDLMSKDCFSLLEKQIRSQTRGIAIKEDQVCDHCNQPLLSDLPLDTLSQSQRASMSADGGSVGGGSSAGTGSGVGSSKMLAQQSGSNSSDLVVFGCHHVFHEECCADSYLSNAEQVDASDMAPKLFTCRVCMLEKDDEIY